MLCSRIYHSFYCVYDIYITIQDATAVKLAHSVKPNPIHSPIRSERFSLLSSSFAAFRCHSRDVLQSGRPKRIGLLGFGAIFTQKRGITSAIAENPGGEGEREDATIFVWKKARKYVWSFLNWKAAASGGQICRLHTSSSLGY